MVCTFTYQALGEWLSLDGKELGAPSSMGGDLTFGIEVGGGDMAIPPLQEEQHRKRKNPVTHRNHMCSMFLKQSRDCGIRPQHIQIGRMCKKSIQFYVQSVDLEAVTCIQLLLSIST